MRDDYLSADWATHHREATGALGRLFETIGTALVRLNAIQYDAPWKRETAFRRPAGVSCPPTT